MKGTLAPTGVCDAPARGRAGESDVNPLGLQTGGVDGGVEAHRALQPQQGDVVVEGRRLVIGVQDALHHAVPVAGLVHVQRRVAQLDPSGDAVDAPRRMTPFHLSPTRLNLATSGFRPQASGVRG